MKSSALCVAIFCMPALGFAETESVLPSATRTFSAGVELSSGKYGGENSTDILYVPLSARYASPQYAFSLTVPYISVTSNGEVIPGAGGVVRGQGRAAAPTASSARTTQSGMGDVLASAGFMVHGTETLTLNLVGNVKFGTANANKALGTGENDYSAQLDGFYAAGAATYQASLGYKLVGEPAGYDFNNIAYGSAGLTLQADGNARAGLRLDAAQSVAAGVEGRRSLNLDVTYALSQHGAVSFALSRGLSTSSPDWLVGAYLSGSP